MPTKIDYADAKTHPPLDEEVLAWHVDGKTWHQVSWDGDNFAMRWHGAYLQPLRAFTHWEWLPPSPNR